MIPNFAECSLGVRTPTRVLCAASVDSRANLFQNYSIYPHEQHRDAHKTGWNSHLEDPNPSCQMLR